MIFGMDIIPSADKLPPLDRRVLVWSGNKWKAAQWESNLHGGAWYFDSGAGPIKFSHWCPMPPNPED